MLRVTNSGLARARSFRAYLLAIVGFVGSVASGSFRRGDELSGLSARVKLLSLLQRSIGVLVCDCCWYAPTHSFPLVTTELSCCALGPSWRKNRRDLLWNAGAIFQGESGRLLDNRLVESV